MKSFIRKRNRQFTLEIPKEIIVGMNWNVSKNEDKIKVDIKPEPNKGILEIGNPNVKPAGIVRYILAAAHEKDLQVINKRNPRNIKKYYIEYNKKLKEKMSADSKYVLEHTDWNNVEEEWKKSPQGKKIIKLFKQNKINESKKSKKLNKHWLKIH